MTTRLEVVEQIIDCTSCELHEAVPMPTPFTGPVPSHVAIIGDAPAGGPFDGPAGALLRSAITDAGGDPDAIAFMNVVSCASSNKPSTGHVAACQPNRDLQLEVIAPRWVLLLGHSALRTFHAALRLKTSHGLGFQVGEVVYYATYPPSEMVGRADAEKLFRCDVAEFFEFSRTGAWLTEEHGYCAACGDDGVWWEDTGIGWCAEHLPAWEEKAYKARLELIAAELAAARERVIDAGGIFERDLGRCRYCGSSVVQGKKPRDGLLATRDHVLPKSRGGSGHIGNMVTACQPCNNRKADMTPGEAGMAILTLAQLRQIEAAERRDSGMAAVDAAADPEWRRRAYEALVRYLETHGEFFVDEFWLAADLEEPREARALGPVVQQAAREGLMEKSGEFRKSTASNLTEKPVWRSLICGVHS